MSFRIEFRDNDDKILCEKILHQNVRVWIKDNFFQSMILCYLTLRASGDPDKETGINHKEALKYFKENIVYVIMSFEEDKICKISKLKWFPRKDIPVNLGEVLMNADLLTQFIIYNEKARSTFLVYLPFFSFNQQKSFIEAGLNLKDYVSFD